jgi:hypothetical protein
VNVVYHRHFQKDINTAVRYYDGEGGQLLGDRLFDEVERTVGRVILRPTACHFIAPGFRRANLKSFPYHIIYEESPTKIKFLILRHNRRHPSYGLRRK